MTFISYAQNYEDVMLYRALKDVERGFYIDVGVSDPVLDSVTKAFYDRGWRGINIEPVSRYYQALCAQRPEDINLQVVASDRTGVLTFFDVPSVRGWGTISAEVEGKYRKSGYEVVATEVQARTLAQICEEHVQGRHIHFLKVDVEGAEKQVLCSMDFHRWRPWIVVIEAVEWGTGIPQYESWEGLLLSCDYEFVYFDGLNRFYVATEHATLHEAFRVPPNVFDTFIYYSESAARARGEQLHQQLCAAHSRIDELQRHIDSMTKSISWRVTIPLRAIKRALRQIKEKLKLVRLTTVASGKSLLKPLLQMGLDIVRQQPALKLLFTRLLSHFPSLDLWLRAFARNQMTEWNALPVSISAESKKKISIRTYVPESSLASKPTVYYWVDHAVRYQSNTGIQRVTRCLARGLLENGEHLVFVKWSENLKTLVLVTQEELIHLAKWGGPALSKEALWFYSINDAEEILIERAICGDWLFIPEVSYITNHTVAPTLEAILRARQLGLKIAFVYYDTIPLVLPEYESLASMHCKYIQHLALSDLILPISHWAGRDLEAVLRRDQCFGNGTIPSIRPVQLAGEQISCPRANESARLPEGPVLILSVGSIEPRKNQKSLIDAFLQMKATNPAMNVQLKLIGHLHPDMSGAIHTVMHACRDIQWYGYVTEEELITFYQQASFTVFPSVEEGFGLPILESLWHGKPCICADFGSMPEVAQGGGCLLVDTRSVDKLQEALEKMIKDPALHTKLTQETLKRPIKSWREYARECMEQLMVEGSPAWPCGEILYWVDHTRTYSANSGIQRVVRALAGVLQNQGVSLTPVAWDGAANTLVAPSEEDLIHLSRWNGPKPEQWLPFTEKSLGSARWLLIPELTTYPGGPDLNQVYRFARAHGLQVAWIFYDAIPWKMRDIYPTAATVAHREYMSHLFRADRVFSISKYSGEDIRDFWVQEGHRVAEIVHKVKDIPLPGEFLETPRSTFLKEPEGQRPIRILSIGTVEPRKNHTTLLQAFEMVVQQSPLQLELTIVGGSSFPELAQVIEEYMARLPNLRWIRGTSDFELSKLYHASDFTVYPSLDEGFGLPILESLWHGKPCICRNRNNMGEIAEGGGCLMVETTNAEELAATIRRLAEDVDLRRQLAREAIIREFKTWEQYARELLAELAPATPLMSRQLKESEDLPPACRYVNVAERPVLSLCITTYNRAEWLALNLHNIFRLLPVNRKDIDILVCDNASTDYTPEVIKSYLDRPGFRYVRK